MTYEEILEISAALLNDQERDVYTNIVMLPYLNIARMELEEIFELNNIPVTNASTAVLTIPDGNDEISFDTTPALPDDLIEIRQLWEATVDTDNYVPIDKREYLLHWATGERNMFGVWSWQDQAVKLLAAIVDIDVKIDYIKSLFTILDIDDITDENEVRNTSSFIQFRTAGLCAEFIGENKTRGDSLTGNAGAALERSLGISVKGKQTIFTRRRPFRAAFKRRRSIL